MPTIQISKIQLRRGLASDLPGAPDQFSSTGFSPGLDDGEFGFTTDTGRLFIGQASLTHGTFNYERTSFPYQNIEVLTENSPPSVFQPVIADNRAGFFKSAPLIVTGSFTTFQTYDLNGVAQNFLLDLPASGVNAIIHYFVFAANHDAIRQGILKIVWNVHMVVAPHINDTPFYAVGNVGDLQWTATLIGSISDRHVVLQYTNQTGGTPTVFFRIDRPIG